MFCFILVPWLSGMGKVKEKMVTNGQVVVEPVLMVIEAFAGVQLEVLLQWLMLCSTASDSLQIPFPLRS